MIGQDRNRPAAWRARTIIAALGVAMASPAQAQVAAPQAPPGGGYLENYRAGRIDQACDLLSRAAPATMAAGAERLRLLNHGVVIKAACGRLADAAADGQAALAQAGATESDRLAVEGNLALVLFQQGKAGAAATMLQRVADRQIALGAAEAAAITRANLAVALWQTDRLEEAVAMLESALEGLPKGSPARLAALLNTTALAAMTLRNGQAFDAAMEAAEVVQANAVEDRSLALRVALSVAHARYLGTRWQDIAAAHLARRAATTAILEADPGQGAHGLFDYIPLAAPNAMAAQGMLLLAGPEIEDFVSEARTQAFNAEPAKGARMFDLIRPLEEQLGATILLGLDLKSAAAQREKLGDSAAALALARRAGQFSLVQFDVDPIVNRDDLVALADQLAKAGLAAEADALRNRIATGPAIIARAKAIERRYYAKGTGPAENLALVEQALRILEGYPGPDSHLYANQLDMKAIFLLEAGRPDEAIPLVQRAIEINRAAFGLRAETVVRQLGLLADLLRFAGRKEEARAQLATLVRIAGETERYIPALVESGNGAEALEWATRQLAMIERTRALAASQTEHNRELAAQGQIGDVPTMAPDPKPVLIERAKVLLALGRPDEAARDARTVLAAIERYKGALLTTWDYPEAQILLGQSLLAMGDAAGGLAAAEKAATILKKRGGSDPIIANSAAVLRARARLANPASAATALEMIAPLTAAALANPVAESLPVPGRLDAATGAIARTDLFALELEARWAAAGVDRDANAAFAAAQRALATPASQAVALAAGRRLAATGNAALGDLAREREDLVGRFIAADQRYAEAAAGVDAAAGQARTEAEADKQAITARFAAIDADLRKAAPGYFALVRQDPLALAATQAALGEDEAVLIVVPGEFGTHLLALTRAGLTWQRSGWNRERIAQAARRLLWFASANVTATGAEIAAWTAEVAGGENGFDRTTAHALWQEVVAPVAPALAGAKRLFVIGGGALSSLPFAMLVAAPPTGSDENPADLRATRWFGDEHALTQLPSLQSLALLRDRPVTARAGAPAFVGFGDPVLDPPDVVPDAVVPLPEGRGAGRRRGGLRGEVPLAAEVIGFRAGGTVPLADGAELRGLKRISGTAIEINAMAKVLGVAQDRLFLAANDREATFRGSPLLRDATIISLATHGLLGGSLSTVAEPGLVFTPPAQPGPPDDGYLTTSEVATLTLRADWVILSACNTAAGDGSAGAPGLSGLARAFFHAGARNLLVSNWPVRDDVAPSLTVGAVERALKDPALSRAQALQQAVKAVRDNPVADKVVRNGINLTWAHPSAWAPFSLVGDGR